VPSHKKKILFVFSKPPHSSQASKEGLDALLTTSAFGQDVSLLFLGDGIFQALNNQNASTLPTKNTAAIFGSLAMYGIENIYAQQQALCERSIDIESLNITPQLLSNIDITKLLNQQDKILTF